VKRHNKKYPEREKLKIAAEWGLAAIIPNTLNFPGRQDV
jgi:hypothetical protein